MTHLTADELTAWYEHGNAADRERVIGHLAECDTCRKALSARAASVEPEISRPVVSIDDVIQRGYAARTPAAARTRAGWLRPLYGLAAAAVIVLAVLWVTAPPRTQDEGAVRGADLIAVAPLGQADARQFAFNSPLQAASYRVTVRDAKGELLFTMTTRGLSVVPDQSLRGRLAAGESYTWSVAALDVNGDTIAESKPATFSYRP